MLRSILRAVPVALVLVAGVASADPMPPEETAPNGPVTSPSEPKVADAPKADAPKADAPKADAPKADAPKTAEKSPSSKKHHHHSKQQHARHKKAHHHDKSAAKAPAAPATPAK